MYNCNSDESEYLLLTMDLEASEFPDSKPRANCTQFGRICRKSIPVGCKRVKPFPAITWTTCILTVLYVPPESKHGIRADSNMIDVPSKPSGFAESMQACGASRTMSLTDIFRRPSHEQVLQSGTTPVSPLFTILYPFAFTHTTTNVNGSPFLRHWDLDVSVSKLIHILSMETS